MNSSSLLLLAFFIKIILIFYGDYQDKHFAVTYTDIDYSVYNDAARYVTQNESPYNRHTYRYTPLLAYICVVDILIHPLAGKFIFSLIDIFASWILFKILANIKTYKTLKGEETSTLIENKETINQNEFRSISDKDATILVSLWAFNPLAIAVSSRGNADTLISSMVLVVLYLMLKKKYVLAAICYGFVVHFKIYPILYALPMYFFIDNEKKPGFFTKNRLLFVFLSAGLFLALLGIFYFMYGWEFLWETYLYHLTRKDNRHNFSVYFYYIYLDFENVSAIKSVLCFLPQITLLILTGYKFYKDLPFCCFLQTFWFVVFNKVCTAQYFIWYLSLLPLILPNNRLFREQGKIKKFIILWLFWLITELGWNVGAHFLEGQGINVFSGIWLASILFFMMNILLGVEILREQKIITFEMRREKIN